MQNGPIDVNGTVTPISNTPIQAITADKWNDMSIDKLLDQRNTLITRLSYVQQYAFDQTSIGQLKQGIDRLDYIIEAKSNEAEDNKLR